MKIAVIVGAGLATRLRPITEIVPKVLVNYGQETILKHLYTTYTNLKADKIILIIPSKFVQITKGYLKYSGIDDIEIKTCDEPLGSAWAIASTIKEEYTGHNIVFNWSDIIPTFDGFKWDSDVIYTYGKSCRYNFNGVMTNVGSTGGNVIGVYQTKSFSLPIVSTSSITDFVDVYDFKDFKGSQLSNAVDIGDFDKLRELSKDLPICRSFNNIEFVGDKVIKTALDEQGLELQKNELIWYSSIINGAYNSRVNVPDIYGLSTNTITMNKIDGQMLSDSPVINHHIDSLLEATFSDKKSVDLLDAINDYKKEFNTKIYDRNKSIAPLLDLFTNKITSVNSLKIPMNHDLLIELAYKEISENIQTDYEIIHGDLNFSNVLVDKSDNLYVIDPRGYFGNSKLYGPKDYDIAKVLYALTGYDLFNKKSDWCGLIIEDNSMSIEIDKLLDYSTDSRFKRHHHVMVGLIWMALAGYFKNNPYKALASYYYGVYLLTSLYEDKIRFYKDDGKQIGVEVNDDRTVRTLITKFPKKWILVDRETGAEYEINTASDSIKSQWTRVK